jgi:ribose 5-phosphate isomerase B
MKIAVGADHAGLVLKEAIKRLLLEQGHEVTDFGARTPESTDYPDYALPVAIAVKDGAAERGVLVCTTGMGMAMAANKVTGVRAALAMNEDEVMLTRAHNDANVLALSAKYTTGEQAARYVGIFLATAFEGGRHQRRLDKISAIEATRRGNEKA